VRPQPFAAILLLLLLCAGCGSGGSDGSDGVRGSAPPEGSIEALWQRPGEDVGLVFGTSDHSVGNVRLSFLVVRDNAEVVERPQARLWLARERGDRPIEETLATFEPVGVEDGEEDPGVRGLFVATVDVPSPGRYWLVAEPIGGLRIQGLGAIDVKDESASPAVGAPAPASQTPTLANAPIAQLSTATEPVPELYRSSIAGSIRDGVPFVVAFATPKFCASRTCGPTVDVVDAVRRETAVRTIHVEVYEDNDPNKGVNEWMREWNLPSEPWVFVVGSDGRVAAKFEGSVSVDELAEAVRSAK
jgi:hypothetical protein